MALSNSFPTGLPAGLSIIDTRRTLAELIVCNSAGVPRLGVLPRNFDPIVTATATMSYAIGAADFVTSRTGQGVELVTNDGTVNVATTAAPSSNARLDVIWVRSRFTASADPLGTPEFNVTQGTASGTVPPPKPSIPAGAVEIATAQIPSTATATNSAGVIITQTAQYTTTQGGSIPFRSTAERALFAAAPGQSAYMIGSKQTTVWNGAKWQGPGMSLVPAVSAVGGTIGSDGSVSFTGVSAVSVNGCFTGDFDNYLVLFDINASTAALGGGLQLRAGGVDATGNVYGYLTEWAQTGGSGVSIASGGLTGNMPAIPLAGAEQSAEWRFFGPAAARATRMKLEALVSATPTSFIRSLSSGRVNDTVAYDGFTYRVSGGSGTITGTIRVYGYNNG